MTHWFVGGTKYCSPCVSVCAELGMWSRGDLNLYTALVCSLQVSHLWLS